MLDLIQIPDLGSKSNSKQEMTLKKNANSSIKPSAVDLEKDSYFLYSVERFLEPLCISQTALCQEVNRQVWFHFSAVTNIQPSTEDYQDIGFFFLPIWRIHTFCIWLWDARAAKCKIDPTRFLRVGSSKLCFFFPSKGIFVHKTSLKEKSKATQKTFRQYLTLVTGM